jgi:acyl phosphate:glycerol-3-phosphate acyltransferase
MDTVLAITLGYLVGSVPFAYLLARRRGIDLRREGSGNVGAANVLRTTGTLEAVTAVCLDVIKGALAVLIVQRVTTEPTAPVAAGLAAVIAHIHPVWLGFRGGKGVATAAGAFAMLSPGAVLIAACVFVAAVWMTRFVSVGSMAAAITLAATTAAGDWPGSVVAGATGTALIILYRHRGNLARVIAGTERRIGQRA